MKAWYIGCMKRFLVFLAFMVYSQCNQVAFSSKYDKPRISLEIRQDSAGTLKEMGGSGTRCYLKEKPERKVNPFFTVEPGIEMHIEPELAWEFCINNSFLLLIQSDSLSFLIPMNADLKHFLDSFLFQQKNGISPVIHVDFLNGKIASEPSRNLEISKWLITSDENQLHYFSSQHVLTSDTIQSINQNLSKKKNELYLSRSALNTEESMLDGLKIPARIIDNQLGNLQIICPGSDTCYLVMGRPDGIHALLLLQIEQNKLAIDLHSILTDSIELKLHGRVSEPQSIIFSEVLWMGTISNSLKMNSRAEFIELYNASDEVQYLGGFRIQCFNQTKKETIVLPYGFFLKPREFYIIYNHNSLSAVGDLYNPFSLNNAFHQCSLSGRNAAQELIEIDRLFLEPRVFSIYTEFDPGFSTGVNLGSPFFERRSMERDIRNPRQYHWYHNTSNDTDNVMPFDLRENTFGSPGK